MNAQQKEALAMCAANLSGIAATLRALDTNFGPAFDQREKDGVEVLAAETDAIVEGIRRLMGPADGPAP